MYVSQASHRGGSSGGAPAPAEASCPAVPSDVAEELERLRAEVSDLRLFKEKQEASLRHLDDEYGFSSVCIKFCRFILICNTTVVIYKHYCYFNAPRLKAP